jgi:hypothetical protein
MSKRKPTASVRSFFAPRPVEAADWLSCFSRKNPSIRHKGLVQARMMTYQLKSVMSIAVTRTNLSAREDT